MSVCTDNECHAQIEAVSFMYFLQPDRAMLTLQDVRTRLEKAQVNCSEEDYLLGCVLLLINYLELIASKDI